jgi:hypothetical protein
MRLLAALLCVTVLVSVGVTCAPQSLAQGQSLRNLLPGFPEGGSTVIVTLDQTRTLDEHAAAFTDPVEAAQLLTDWGWEANVVRQYEETQPSDPGTTRPYLYISVARFQDETGAAAALPYVAQDLGAELGHRELPMSSLIGDESRQYVAPVDGGTDLTLYVRSGPLLMRVSTLLGDGSPTFDPVAVAEGIMGRQAAPPAPLALRQSMLPALLETLPPDLPACLRLYGEEEFDFPALVARFPGLPDAEDQLAACEWEAGAYRQFTCDVPPASGLNWVDMSVHQLGDAASAAEAVPYFAYARTVGTQLAEAPSMPLGDQSAALAGPSELGTELTLYVSIDRLLLRVTGIARNEDPRADTELVMTALFVHNTAEVRAPEAALQSIPTATPAPLRPSPTPLPSPRPTATAVPQPTVPPPVPTQPLPQGNCDPSYPDVWIPPPPPDLDCNDVPYADIQVIGADPHRLDGPYDGSLPNEPDGIGCEWN